MADATRELVIQDFATKSDIAALKAELLAFEQRLTALGEGLTLRLTVRLGLMLAAGLSILAAIQRLH